MLTFEPFSICTLQSVLPYIHKSPYLCEDLSAGYLFMWHDGTDIQFCIWNETFAVRQIIGEQVAFSYPFGEDPDGMLDELMEYACINHLPLRFFAVNEETLGKIQADDRLQPAMYAYDRRWSDYIYDFEDAMTFKGKRYSGQRNHINKFKKLYGEPEIRFLTEEDRPGIEELFADYEKEHPAGNLLEKKEFQQTRKLYDIYPLLGLYAAGLFVNGKAAGISIGEVIGDVLMIHVEKALARYEGIYPALYSGFVQLIHKRLGRPLKYVNREDDSGDPGLRTSKLQYHPVFIQNKHLVHVNSPAGRMKPPVTIVHGDVVLTEIREGDKQAYLKMNTDIENNRYWGYDYREDINLTGPVDENIFYDSVMYDMRAGDSVNFAVRLAEDGEMIGEAVLWNFTSDGSAELGCRILPEFQGHGYGTAAFTAAADFGVRKLNVKVNARCHVDNAASYRMITASGFNPLCKHQDYYYFSQSNGNPCSAHCCGTLRC